MFQLDREARDELVARMRPPLRTQALETHLAHHDKDVLAIVKAIKKLMSPEEPPKVRQIGFRTPKEART